MTETTEIDGISPEEGSTTDPPMASDLGSVEEFVARWKNDLEDQVSVPASSVQDRLLDLWGALPEGHTRAEVESWLTETLGRNLYTVADIDTRLETVVHASS